MAEYQVVDKTVHDAELKSIGDSIRAKGGTTAPFNSAAEMKAAVDAIKTGGGGDDLQKHIESSGTGTFTSGANKIYDYRLSYSGYSKISLTNAKSLGRYAIGYCTSMVELEIPNLEVIGYGSIIDASSLRALDGRSVRSVESGAIKRCGAEIVKFPRLEELAGYVLDGSKNLTAFVVGKENPNVCSLSSILGNGLDQMYIYVPKALIEQYKVATNWVRYASQIRAIEDYPEITGG